MASSLEELLAKEGFKGSRRMSRRSSFQIHTQSDAVSVPRYSFSDQHKRFSVSSERIKTERTKSDVTQYQVRSGELSNSKTAMSLMRPRDNLARGGKMDEGLKNEDVEKPSSNPEAGKKFDLNFSEDMPRCEITEVSEEEDNIVKDTYSNETFNAKQAKEKILNEFREKEKWRESPVKDAKVDKRHSSNYNLSMRGHFSGNTRKNIKEQGKSYNRSTSQSFEDSRKKNHVHTVQAASNLAIDEVAVQAVVSILNGYIKRFLKDEDFRTMLHHNCFSSLNFIELEEENSTETKVIRSLEQTIETIEQVAEGSVPSKDLKRASLQLSIITGLSLNDLKYEFTCGIPNYKLSACAHLYLSVIYKIQRKDKVSAKHLLQVFCDSPFQARTILLPELWEYLFSPQLVHLKAWYKKEVDILPDRPSRTRKLNLLEKVYNEHLDSGTYIFSVYYKDWLTDGVEPPSIPSINVPSISLKGSQQGSSFGHSSELSSSMDPLSPQPIVSKKLYDSVFGSLNTPAIDEDEDDNDLGTHVRGSYGSAIVKQTFTYAYEKVKFTDQDIEDDFNKNVLVVLQHPQKGFSVIDEEEKRESNCSDDIGHSLIPQQTNLYSDVLDSKEKEVALEKVTGSNLEKRNIKSSVDSTVSWSSKKLVSYSALNPNMIISSFEGLSFPTIPQEFICPLTGNLFEEPVTIETGQTFERTALKSWLEMGHRTCPVTGATLDCVAMPLTNLVLKRLIHNWKSEHLSQFLDSASQILKNSRESKKKHKDEIATFKLESFFAVLNEEDKSTYAKHLTSSGVLPFLLRRFELANLEEKTHVAALLLNLIEADSCCIHQIARDINKECLLELLHCKEVTARTNAILLLTELLALKRRKDVISFLSGLMKGEDVFITMHVLLVYLKNSPPHLKPLIAVLLLYYDLLIEPQKYSIYREQAVNSISVAFDASLNDEKVREKCCRSLFILAGHFSSSGKILTKNSILKEVGYQNDNSEVKTPDHEEEGLSRDGTISLEEEEEERIKEWMVNLLETMIGDGESPFLKTISRCLGSRHPDLVSMCLITVAWLSSSLSTQCNAGLNLAAFLAVISQIKEVLENGELELKTLASMCLLNFSKISECRTLLMTMAEDIVAPLHSLAEVTWTAKQLHAIVSGKHL